MLKANNLQSAAGKPQVGEDDKVHVDLLFDYE
jgi:hypothetical protein